MQFDFFKPQREALESGLRAISEILPIVEEITKQYPQFSFDTNKLKALKADYERGLEQCEAGILHGGLTSGTDEVVLAARKWIESVIAEISSGNAGGGKSL